MEGEDGPRRRCGDTATSGHTLGRICRAHSGKVTLTTLYHILTFNSNPQFLFTKESYDKPLFTTYFKTSLFSIYLVAFLFWRPWQRQCCKQAHLCVRKKEEFVKNDERQTPQNHATAEAQQKVIDHQEENDQINVRLAVFILNIVLAYTYIV